MGSTGMEVFFGWISTKYQLEGGKKRFLCGPVSFLLLTTVAKYWMQHHHCRILSCNKYSTCDLTKIFMKTETYFKITCSEVVLPVKLAEEQLKFSITNALSLFHQN